MPEYIRLDDNLNGTCLTCADYAPPMWYLCELPDGRPGLMCATCIEQLGRQVGMSSDEQLEDAKQALQEKTEELAELKEQLNALMKDGSFQVLTIGDAKRLIEANRPKYVVKARPKAKPDALHSAS